MKYSVLLTTIFCILFLANSHARDIIKKTNLVSESDTISHVLDGSTSEWPVTKIEQDKETNIKYAIDNDEQDLFLALIVPDFRTQMKMMRLGMKLFIDMKGKKKENRGIEFPVKRDEADYSGGFSGNNQNNNQEENSQENDQQRKFDKKRIRNSMALNLIYMKLFGFSSGESLNQGLQMEGSAQIAFAWDSADVMHIEYLLPLKLLKEQVAELNDKNISIGWQINGIDIASNSSSSFGNSSFGGSGGGGRGGRGGGFNRGGGGNSSNFPSADRQRMSEPQSFWTKYTFIIPVAAKGF